MKSPKTIGLPLLTGLLHSAATYH